MPPRRAPFRCAGGVADEGAAIDRPGGDRLRVQDLHLAAHDVAGEGFDHAGRYPGCPEAGCDAGWRHVLRLAGAQGLDVAFELPVEGGGGFGRGQLRPHRTRQIGVGGFPGLGDGVAEHGGVELPKRLVGVALQ